MLRKSLSPFQLMLLCLFLPFSLTPVAAQSNVLSGNPQTCLESYDPALNYFPDQVSSDYAVEWDVEYFSNYKVIRVNTQVSGVNETYVLVQCGTPVPELTGALEGAIPFEIPIQRLWEGGGGTYAAIEALGIAETLIGVTYIDAGMRYVPSVYSHAVASNLPQVNYGESNEPIVAAQPDLYVQYEGDEDRLGKRDVGIPVVHYDPFSESPLGSAEQVKFLSLFYNLEARANTVFAPIEARYLALRDLAQAQTEQPTVLLGNIVGEGTSFRSREPERLESHLVRDAGGTLILEHSDLPFEKAFIGIDYDLESVIALASEAEFWFGMHYTPAESTAAEFITVDPLNGNFSALANGNMFHRFGPRGEDYFGTGGLYVDLILRDLVSILHPELIPDYQPMFLQRVPGL
jgi:iron complex transport system substrate-binding protein